MADLKTKRKTFQSYVFETPCAQDAEIFIVKWYKMKKEDCEQIFKIRSRVTQAKLNQKNRYDTYECESCEIADESQEHILTLSCVALF